ncbi:hypothetical protein Acr_00g0074280 [Actinidia rufa]|uniref:Uncharacterized protein n=1 Tax=Actinidia rufa TaxID=165716 RepID=A0A7J0DSU7_9ERIC|nr:hypothetical protein Acr_00g0074280 [Actinidia rufa]
MTELRDIVQMLVESVTAQQQLLQQHFQPPQPQETRKLDSNRGKTQQGKTLEYNGVTEDPVIPMESVSVNLREMTIADYEGSFTNLAEYVPHLVATDEIRARRFEDGLMHEIRRAIRPLVLLTYADVLDKAIIVEIEVRNKIRCFQYKEVGHIKRNYSRLRTEAVAPRGGPIGGNMRSAENARLGGNRPRNPGNRSGNVNN